MFICFVESDISYFSALFQIAKVNFLETGFLSGGKEF